MIRRSARRTSAVIALAMLTALEPAAGQALPPTRSDNGSRVTHLRGRVIDSRSRAAISGAQVILDADGRFVNADSTGTYDFAGIPKGMVDLSVRAPTFKVAHYTLQLIGNGNWVQDIELDSIPVDEHAVRLAAVPVTASGRPFNYRLQGFEIRRQSGRGQYLTDDQIRASGASNIQDAVRDMRGVATDCSGTFYGGCRIRMITAPARCLPVYFVDGQVDNSFGPTTPIRDVIAMEVYTGPADVPGEFAGSNAACGVVALWTRSGPDRRRPREP
jgi:Carboxypeptidase regulatory-like domain